MDLEEKKSRIFRQLGSVSEYCTIWCGSKIKCSRFKCFFCLFIFYTWLGLIKLKRTSVPWQRYALCIVSLCALYTFITFLYIYICIYISWTRLQCTQVLERAALHRCTYPTLACRSPAWWSLFHWLQWSDMFGVSSLNVFVLCYSSLCFLLQCTMYVLVFVFN